MSPRNAVIALSVALALALSGAWEPAAAAKPGREIQASPEGRIRIVARPEPRQGSGDQLHLFIHDGGEKIDLSLPLSWIRFAVKHLDGKAEINLSDDDEGIDLGLLWETIESLGPGEELVIEDGAEKLRIWIE